MGIIKSFSGKGFGKEHPAGQSNIPFDCKGATIVYLNSPYHVVL
jgi:hypothetical protein